MKRISLEDRKNSANKKKDFFFVHEKNCSYKTFFYKPLNVQKKPSKFVKSSKNTAALFLAYARKRSLKAIHRNLLGRAYDDTKKILYGRYLRRMITQIAVSKQSKVLMLAKEESLNKMLKIPSNVLKASESYQFLGLFSGVTQFSIHSPRMKSYTYMKVLKGFYDYRKKLVDDYLKILLQEKSVATIINSRVSLEEILRLSAESIQVSVPYRGQNKLMMSWVEDWELAHDKTFYAENLETLEHLNRVLKIKASKPVETRPEEPKTTRTFREHFFIQQPFKASPYRRSRSGTKARICSPSSQKSKVPRWVTEVQNKQENKFKIKLRTSPR